MSNRNSLKGCYLSAAKQKKKNCRQGKFLRRIHSFFLQLFILLLCSNILLASTNHVVCLELSGNNISKNHFQQYECKYPQGSNTVYYKHPVAHAHNLYSDILGTTAQCHNCIDEHIQFKKSTSNITFSTLILQKNIFYPYLRFNDISLLNENRSSIQLYNFNQLSTQQSSIIRSTVLLI